MVIYLCDHNCISDLRSVCLERGILLAGCLVLLDSISEEGRPKPFVVCTNEWLGEEVRNHVSSSLVYHLHVASSNPVRDKEVADADVLRVLGECSALHGHCHGAGVVLIHARGADVISLKGGGDARGERDNNASHYVRVRTTTTMETTVKPNPRFHSRHLSHSKILKRTATIPQNQGKIVIFKNRFYI